MIRTTKRWVAGSLAAAMLIGYGPAAGAAADADVDKGTVEAAARETVQDANGLTVEGHAADEADSRATSFGNGADDGNGQDRTIRYTDIDGHWAAEAIGKWSGKGIVSGRPGGVFDPNGGVTRAEFVSMLARLFDYADKSGTSFFDVPAGAWYADAVAEASAAGIVSGDGQGAFKPEAPISRQEAAVILYRALGLDAGAAAAADKFRDANRIASWSRDAVLALVEQGYMAGKPGAVLAPEAGLTRAEAVKLIGNAAGELESEAGVYTGQIASNLIVNASGVTLKNMEIAGNLYLAEGIGEGEVSLDHVIVRGGTFIRGGGAHSVSLTESVLAGKVQVNKMNGAVRLRTDDKSSVEKLVLRSNVLLEGSFGEMSLEAPGLTVEVQDGSIRELAVRAGGSAVTLGQGVKLAKLTARSGVTVAGGGSIGEALIEADGVSLAMQPAKTTVAAGKTASVGGRKLEGGANGATIEGTAGQAGDSGASGPTPTAAPTPTPSPTTTSSPSPTPSSSPTTSPTASPTDPGTEQPIAVAQPAAYAEALLLKPAAATAGSEADGHPAASAADNSGMDGFFGPLEAHSAAAGGTGMWLTADGPGADNWLRLDLGAVYPLGKLLVWNYNEPGATDEGIKNAQIQYSIDGTSWATLGGEGATSQFAKADGMDGQKASNVSAPVDFGGAPARYVRILPNEARGDGNWGGGGDGGPAFGISEIRLYQYYSPVEAAGRQIAPIGATAGSESSDAPAMNAINNVGMSGASSKDDTHAPTGGWLTAANADAANAWIQFDLGGTYPLGELRIWNYNGEAGDGAGIRWAKVKYSLDNIGWTYLNGGAPYEFARSSSAAAAQAGNRADSGDPVYFGGVSARYVRIEPSGATGKPGNWGGTASGEQRYGLGQVRFYSAAGLVTESAPEWSSLFARTEGWTGSDGIFSIPYDGVDASGHADETNTLFLFSDTFTGSVDPVTKARDLQGFYNNSLATLTGGNPDPAKLSFLWGSDGTGQDFKSIFEPTTPYAYVGTVAANVVREAAGMSPLAAPTAPGEVQPPQASDTHDNDKDGATMWLTAADPGAAAWIKFDLTSEYALGKMPVWNYNQFDPDHPEVPYVGRGLKNAAIYYSSDDVTYVKLGDYQFAEASGAPKLEATNLTDGSEVDFGGVTARYIKIVPNATAGDGNWGGATGSEAMFGLSQVRFYTASSELLRYAEAEAGSTYRSEPAGNWYWLQDGLSLDGRFHTFALNMAPDPSQPPGWQFKVVGVAMAGLPGPGGPDLGGITQTDTPLYYTTSLNGWSLSYTYGAGVMPNTAEAGAADPDGYIYVYGYRDYAFERLLTVARVKAADFGDFNAWRFWGGSAKGWSRSIEDSAPLLTGVSVSAELSVTPVKSGPLAGKYLLVFEKDSLSNYMTYSVGDSPVGPFGPPVPFYYATEPAAGQTINTYNAKAHPHLSADGELLVSYNVNATDSQVHYTDGTIYRPRWLRMHWITGPAVTDLQAKSGQEAVVTGVSNTAGTIRIAAGTTAGTLLSALASTDGSPQSYAAYAGPAAQTPLDPGAALASGQVLRVTAADGARTASYTIAVGAPAQSGGTVIAVRTAYANRLAATASVVEAVYGTTAAELKLGLASGDGSQQAYAVLSGPGGDAVADGTLLADGQILRVTASDGLTTADYELRLAERYIAGVTATAGSEENFYGVWSASHTTDGSGMSGADGAKTDLHGTSYTDLWLSTADADPDNNWVRFDLGGVWRLGELRVWNYNEAGQPDKGIRNAAVEYSADGAQWTKLGDYEFAKASGAEGLASTDLAGGGAIDFGGAEVRYVRIVPHPGAQDGNYGGFGAGLNPYFGLSEVRFYTALPTP